MTRFAGLAAVLLAVAPLQAADGPNLDGPWLFDECTSGKSDDLPRVWESVVTVKGDRFTLTKLMGHPKDLTGRLAFDPADPDAIDLVLDELDFTPIGAPVKLPAGTYRGKLDAKGDRVSLALARAAGEKRPVKIEPSQTQFYLSLTRAPAGFKEFPKEVTVVVTKPDGTPAAGAGVAGFLDMRTEAKGDTKPAWKLYEAVTAGADGKATWKYGRPPGVVRDEGRKLIAFVKTSPAQLAGGELKVALQPECRVAGKIVSPELEKAGGKVGWTNVYLMHNGRRVASMSSSGGAVELVAPPGAYTLNAYGEELPGDDIPITVPPDRSEHTLPPIELKASALAFLKGKPAPELEGVMGWAGKPVKFTDLKGQYVLVDFWGFWCGPCIGAMPVLIELHEKFHDKGLAIVGVHVDIDGDVDTAAKLDEKIAGFVKDAWKGKALPFPSALVSGKRGEDGKRLAAPPKQYGVQGYPTTILIDRDGKVVGAFHARDIKTATAEVEKLLKK
jgi:thiol-disulfide isomerase/thioredoxin